MPDRPPDDSTTSETAARVYSETAARYAEEIGTEITAAIEAPIDRAALLAFVESVVHVRVADVGCGPGRATAFLARAGLEPTGFDLAPGMLAVARSAHPELSFEPGSLTDLPVADGSCGGVSCWYSIIHTAPASLPSVWRELHRVLAEGAPLLVAFQAGEGEQIDRPNAQGTTHTLTNFRHAIADVSRGMADAGFVVAWTVWREAAADHETTPQGFVLARRRATMIDP